MAGRLFFTVQAWIWIDFFGPLPLYRGQRIAVGGRNNRLNANIRLWIKHKPTCSFCQNNGFLQKNPAMV